MNTREALKLCIDMGSMVSLGYLQDLTDADFMRRPHPKCNHINWQVGHLITSEHHLIDQVAPGKMPPLPEGFAEKYSKDTAGSDNPQDFATKDQLMEVLQQQRAATLAALEETGDADFDKPTGVDYAPTVGAMYSLVGSHWLMHAGQWVIVRRELGHAPMF